MPHIRLLPSFNLHTHAVTRYHYSILPDMFVCLTQYDAGLRAQNCYSTLNVAEHVGEGVQDSLNLDLEGGGQGSPVPPHCDACGYSTAAIKHTVRSGWEGDTH